MSLNSVGELAAAGAIASAAAGSTVGFTLDASAFALARPLRLVGSRAGLAGVCGSIAGLTGVGCLVGEVAAGVGVF